MRPTGPYNGCPDTMISLQYTLQLFSISYLTPNTRADQHATGTVMTHLVTWNFSSATLGNYH